MRNELSRREFVRLGMIGAGGFLMGLLPTTVRARQQTYPYYAGSFLSETIWHIADEKGFLKDAGVTFDISVYTATTDWYNRITTMNNGIAQMWADTYLEILLKGVDAVVLGGIQFSPTIGVGLRKGMEPRNVRRIGIPGEWPSFKWGVWKYYTSLGLDFSVPEFVILDDKDIGPNIKVGRIDAVVSNQRHITPLVDKGVVDMVWKQSIRDAQATKGVIVAQTSTYNAMPRDDLSKIWRALINTINFVNQSENHEDMRQTLRRAYKAADALEGHYVDTSSLKGFQAQLERIQFFSPEEMLAQNVNLEREIRGVADFRRDILGQDVSAFSKNLRVDVSALMSVLADMGYK